MHAFEGYPPAATPPHDVPGLLELDQIAPLRFRNRHHQANVSNALFGGQIVAQALAAADRTVDAHRQVHSLHAYFLHAGSTASLIDYDVEPLRDGQRFSTRRVSAVQGGRTIFSMECSYRTVMEGFSHQRTTAIPFTPEDGLGGDVLRTKLAEQNLHYTALFDQRYPVDVRIPSLDAFANTQADARRHYWLRAVGAETVTDPAEHRRILAFLSDFLLAGAPLVPHTVPLPGPHLFVASLDHAMWFHREVRCDDWLLFETCGPNAQGGVNLAQGHVYDRQGSLVASLAQEVLQYPT
ncbi:MAG: hypothetical protein RIS94_2319 [Pseudomonadota bacterium]|jgi:acyl-CoA thioesterase-2